MRASGKEAPSKDGANQMAMADAKTASDESRITTVLLQKKIVTEGQLKAALDYQKSLGGRIMDILVKLDLIRAVQVEEVLRRMEAGEKVEEKESEDRVLSPDSVSVSELKIHRRLLEKLPEDLVYKYLIVLFFPPPHLSARSIILGHGKDIAWEVVEKIKSLLGVDLRPYALGTEVAKDLLQWHRHGRGARKATAEDKTQSCSSTETNPGPVDLNTLVKVLLKKGIITNEELQAEMKKKR